MKYLIRRVVVRRTPEDTHDVWVDGLFIGTYKTHSIAMGVASRKVNANDRKARWSNSNDG
jgi:hypothetical protein